MLAKYIFNFAWILIRKGWDSLKILSTLSEKTRILLRTNGIAINGNFCLALSLLNHSVKHMADDICRWHRLASWHRGTAFASPHHHGQIYLPGRLWKDKSLARQSWRKTDGMAHCFFFFYISTSFLWLVRNT